jgi:hypothetical protein
MNYFQTCIPEELIREIERFLCCDESWVFLNTSKKLFSEIKFATRKICLRGEDLKRFFKEKKYRNEIVQKVLDRNKQLLFSTMSTQRFSLEHITDEAISEWFKIRAPEEMELEYVSFREITQAFKKLLLKYTAVILRTFLPISELRL